MVGMAAPLEWAPLRVPQPASIASLESLLNPPVEIKPLEKFLRFHLNQSHSMLLPLEDIIAVQAISILDVLPVPQMSACVLGLSNWRGEALWLVDLLYQLGFDEILQPAQSLTILNAIVVQFQGKWLGLTVQAIGEIEEHDPEKLVHPSPDLFAQPLAAFIKGYFGHDHSIVLSTAAILQDPALHSQASI
ncbi:chemotaxis protein CheW [Cyanobacteria bacterium FACHB-DQ100]|uniref:chemotaxis protein CheW n=1 Tax=Leptolyngbya sp. DQ-M1 TaxID=2933920 RepID=UPI0019CB9D09|nr:chemotaxis protein CheW [Cyanobacteria bacterium FACHB-DQ100]